jgi:integrase
MYSRDVTIWTMRRRKGRKKPYEVRWTVQRAEHSKSYLTSALAEDFRSDLLKAARRGEPFDVQSGMPESMLAPVKPDRTWFEFASAYVAKRWPSSAAKTRESIVDSLAAATLATLVGAIAGESATTVRAAARWALVPAHGDLLPPEKIADAAKALPTSTIRMSQLNDKGALEAIVDRMATTLRGELAAPDTVARRRRVLNTALEYAVDAGDLDDNPLRKLKRKKVRRDDQVDRRVVVNPTQAENLLVAVSYVGSWRRARGRRLRAFFATLYYAGVRPAEAVGLRIDDCDLPESGWGSLAISVTRPTSGKTWTDSGEVHDKRGLKQRESTAVRHVPIPPELVNIPRKHFDEFGAADDGRLFTNERGGVLGSSTYSRAWEEARQIGLTPSQARGPLAGRPYDLRHAALSTWLSAGVPAAEVADRAGNSVEVLNRRYHWALDNRTERSNKLIEKALTAM